MFYNSWHRNINYGILVIHITIHGYPWRWNTFFVTKTNFVRLYINVDNLYFNFIIDTNYLTIIIYKLPRQFFWGNKSIDFIVYRDEYAIWNDIFNNRIINVSYMDVLHSLNVCIILLLFKNLCSWNNDIISKCIYFY